MKIAISIFTIIVAMQYGITQQFEYRLPREPTKYSNNVLKVTFYKQRLTKFDSTNINGDFELTGNPRSQMEFDNGLLKKIFQYDWNRTITYIYDKWRNLAAELIETENNKERRLYQYDFDNMKLEVIKNDTQTYYTRFFDNQSRLIREIQPDEFTAENKTSSKRYFYDDDKLKLEEYYENGILKIFKHYSYDKEANVETRLTFNERGEFYVKRIKEYDGEDLAVQTEFRGTGEKTYRYIYISFRDRYGNIIKRYELNDKANVATIYEYRIEYEK